MGNVVKLNEKQLAVLRRARFVFVLLECSEKYLAQAAGLKEKEVQGFLAHVAMLKSEEFDGAIALTRMVEREIPRILKGLEILYRKFGPVDCPALDKYCAETFKMCPWFARSVQRISDEDLPPESTAFQGRPNVVS